MAATYFTFLTFHFFFLPRDGDSGRGRALLSDASAGTEREGGSLMRGGELTGQKGVMAKKAEGGGGKEERRNVPSACKDGDGDGEREGGKGEE
jgi:hypothetical protein